MNYTVRKIQYIHTLLKGQDYPNYILMKREREKLYDTTNKTPFNIYWGKILSEMRAKYGYRIPSRRETRLQRINREALLPTFTERQEARKLLNEIDAHTTHKT